MEILNVDKETLHAVQFREAHKKLQTLEKESLLVLDELMYDTVLDADRRWFAIAKTHIEQGIMAAEKAVRNSPVGTIYSDHPAFTGKKES